MERAASDCQSNQSLAGDTTGIIPNGFKYESYVEHFKALMHLVFWNFESDI